jgi:hypothetical protein
MVVYRCKDKGCLGSQRLKRSIPILKYINNPIISFNVVTKGPIASAGSIRYRWSNMGNSVPKVAANTITVNKDKLTTVAN